MLNNVLNLKTSREVWSTLDVICDGTESVRENKLQMLTQSYEWFLHKQGETFGDLFNRFNRLINDLKAHGKEFQRKDINNKFMRSLPSFWDAKVTAISEATDLKTMTLEDLYGNLQTYEMKIKQRQEMVEDTKRVRSVALIAQRKYAQDQKPRTLMQDMSGGSVAEKEEEEENTKDEQE